MTARRIREGPFVRSIENRLAEIGERPAILAPREFALAASWHARGIPLPLILETIGEIAAKRRAGRGAPRTLGYYAAAVEESWRALREGRAARSGERRSGPPHRRDAWLAAIDARPPGDPLSGALRGLLARLEGGEPAPAIDAALDAVLLEGRGGAHELEAARNAARAALAPYRERMTEEAWRKTLDRAIVDRLRDRSGLPRLGAAARVV